MGNKKAFFMVSILMLAMVFLVLPIAKVKASGGITFDADTKIITVVGQTGIGDTEGNAFDCEDVYDADKAGTLQLLNTTTCGWDISLDRQVQPSDNRGLRLSLIITNLTILEGFVELRGTNIDDLYQVETVRILANTTYVTKTWFRTIDTGGIDCHDGMGIPLTEGFNLEITQPQWGVVGRNFADDKRQYVFDCRIQIGDGINTTWFIDTMKEILFTKTSASSYQYGFFVKNNGHLRFGTLIDATKKICKDGVSILFSSSPPYINPMYGEANSKIDLFSCYIKGTHRARFLSLRGTNRIYETTFDTCTLYFFTGTNDFYRITSMMAQYPLRSCAGNFEDLLIHDAYTYVVLYEFGVGGDLKNVVVKNRPTILVGFNPNVDVDRHLINWEIEGNWTFYFSSDSSGDAIRQYEFDLTVTFDNNTAINGTETGARVVIQHYGENAGVDYNETLGEDGTIPMQTLTKEFYNYTGGNTPYICEPLNLYVYNVSGYDEYSQNFTISQKTAWKIALTAKTGFTSGLGLGFVLAIMVALIGVLGITYWKKR